MNLTTPPVAEIAEALNNTLADHRQVILEAPPGAGKSTYLPLTLLKADWLAGDKILMLEPRRLAASTVARFMARQLGEKVGSTIGYRTKLDTQVSKQTRLEVITEGILTRMIQADPELTGVALVIFDEFHERSLQSELALALCLDLQSALREDLRLLIMSATLAGIGLDALLPVAPRLVSKGRQFPVETVYQAYDRKRPLCPQVCALVLRALREQEGSLLVFLPGMADINRVQRELESQLGSDAVQLTPLYGGLSPRAQQQAIQPAAPGQRKVVLTTNIAETSLTIEGITVVVDSGLKREARFAPALAATQLHTVEISQASAAQRQGRAGRLEPGVCYRLWSESTHHRRAPQDRPEIHTSDLSDMVLELALWGVTSADQLIWLSPPEPGNWSIAQQQLQRIGALDASLQLTALGRGMARFGCAPTLAAMMLRAQQLEQQHPELAGISATAAHAAAIVSELPFAPQGADLELALQRLGSNPQALKGSARVQQLARGWCRRLDCKAPMKAELAGLAIALGMPHWLAQQRGRAYQLALGCGAALPPEDALSGKAWLAVASLQGSSSADARIAWAAEITLQDLQTYLPQLIVEVDRVHWEPSTQRVLAERRLSLGKLALTTRPLQISCDQPEYQRALAEGIAARGINKLPWSESQKRLRQRVSCARQWLADGELSSAGMPDLSDAWLNEHLNEWLLPLLQGVRQPAEIACEHLEQALALLLPWSQRQQLDKWLPERWQTPAGSQAKILYDGEAQPKLAVRMQEMYGQAETPSIANGRISLLLELLSPAGRPLQLTQDLAGFWCNGYREVQKEMKGRYPKHYWPDDPATAQPTTRTKRHIAGTAK